MSPDSSPWHRGPPEPSPSRPSCFHISSTFPSSTAGSSSTHLSTLTTLCFHPCGPPSGISTAALPFKIFTGLQAHLKTSLHALTLYFPHPIISKYMGLSLLPLKPTPKQTYNAFLSVLQLYTQLKQSRFCLPDIRCFHVDFSAPSEPNTLRHIVGTQYWLEKHIEII